MPRFQDGRRADLRNLGADIDQDADIEVGAADPGRLDDAKEAGRMQIAFGVVRQAAQALAVGGAFVELGSSARARRTISSWLTPANEAASSAA